MTRAPELASGLAGALRQMLAVLESERQALAALDIDALSLATHGKHHLCATLEPADGAMLDQECRGLAEAARAANEINRKVRNLLAANIAARLDGLTGSARLYRSPLTSSRHTIANA